jgi:phosphopantothenoylcysteine synthetase/decarboxylase
MKLLVTAGNTQTPIDKVRCITNVFTGRTGARIALAAQRRGHSVTLLTSRPEAVGELGGEPSERWLVRPYRTFEDLQGLLRAAVAGGGLDAVVHCAAVNDYLGGGVYGLGPHTRFRDGVWSSSAGPPTLVDRAAAKVKSGEPELWLRLVRAPKIVDQFRGEWGFRGVLVKFKLEVGVGDEQLLEVAEASRRQSDADLMVANTLEGAADWAFLGPLDGRYEKVPRDRLDQRLLDELERRVQERTHG